ncbi:HAD hydrolase family protein [Providencia stuartii]
MQMLQYAKFPVAMGNAIDNVRDIAKFVTATNNEDGVAVALNKFINQQ